jgi:uncharacterized protein
LADADPTVRFESDLLGGVVVLSAGVEVAAPDDGWEERLYRTAQPRRCRVRIGAREITGVPYYAWANRDPGAMLVWLRSG